MTEPITKKDSASSLKGEMTESEKRYLVLGSTGYAAVDSVEWDVAELPNIVDYDAVIVDVRALNEEKIALVTNKRFEILRTQLTRLLYSKGQIIIVSDFFRRHDRPKQYPESADNYSWCPLRLGIANESGESLEFKEKRFSGYLKHLEHWPYYFFAPNSCLSRELENMYGSTYDTTYAVPSLPFVVNRYGKTIAGAYFIVAERETKKLVSGEIVMLPLIEKLDNKEAVRLVLEELTGISSTFMAPSWVETVKIPPVAEIDEEINKRQQQIDTISSEISKLETRRYGLNEYRKLLYASGYDLEEIVKASLVEMGGQVIPAKHGQEEYILVLEDTEYLVEVKGVSKSISLTHLRQLTDYILRYEEETGKACKGILFGNAWRNEPPSERDKDDKPEFPKNVVDRATQLGIALVSSTRFFNAFTRFLSDRSLGKKILREMVAGSGIVEFKD